MPIHLVYKYAKEIEPDVLGKYPMTEIDKFAEEQVVGTSFTIDPGRSIMLETVVDKQKKMIEFVKIIKVDNTSASYLIPKEIVINTSYFEAERPRGSGMYGGKRKTNRAKHSHKRSHSRKTRRYRSRRNHN